MKKLIAAILTIAMLLALLTGCGGETAESAAVSSAGVEATEEVVSEPAPEAPEVQEASVPEEATESVAAEEPVVEEPVSIFPLEEPATLTAWAMWIPGIEQFIESPMDSQVFSEMAELTNVTVEMTLASSPESAMTEINLLLASGDYPDLINNLGNYYTAGLDAAIEQEIIYNIVDFEDLMPNYFGKLNETGTYDQAFTDEGNIGAVYQIGTAPDESNKSGLTLRQDWLEEQGLEAPTTYDELHDILLTFKSEYGISQPLYVPKSGIPDSMFDGFGTGLGYVMNNENGSAPWGYLDTEDGLEVVFGFMDDSFYDVLELMNTWFNDGLFTADYLNHNYNVDVSNMTEGQSGALFAAQQSLNAANTFQEHMYAAYPNISLDGGKIVTRNTQSPSIGNQGYSITTCCEDVELAAQYLDFQYTDESYVLNNYGVEGVSFEYDENGKPALTELIMNNADGIPQAYTQFIYLSVTGSFYCDTYRFMSNYCVEAKECIDIWKSAYDYQDSPYNTNEIQLTAEERETYAQIFSDISTYCNEMVASFILGQTELTEASFEEFRNNLVSMGIEECAELYQAAADRYLDSLNA